MSSFFYDSRQAGWEKPNDSDGDRAGSGMTSLDMPSISFLAWQAVQAWPLKQKRNRKHVDCLDRHLKQYHMEPAHK